MKCTSYSSAIPTQTLVPYKSAGVEPLLELRHRTREIVERTVEGSKILQSC